MLPASFGDSILIEYGEVDDEKYILIDGGPHYQFDEIVTTLKENFPKLKELELLIITHIDIDHIDGTIRLVNHDPPLFKIKKIWFNNYDHLSFEEPADILGGVQGSYMSMLIDKNDLPTNEKPISIHRSSDELKISDELDIKVINPTQAALSDLRAKWDKQLKEKGLDNEEKIWEALNGDQRYESLPDDLLGDDDKVSDWAEAKFKEDKSPANKSSIAFIITYKDKSCLMAADATSEDLKSNLESLNLLDEFDRITVDAWKLSHHGSKKSTQTYLTEMIQAKHILVSSDGKRYRHPDKETIAKLLVNQEEPIEITFNYTSSYNMIWANEQLTEDYNCLFHFPDEEGFNTVTLIE